MTWYAWKWKLSRQAWPTTFWWLTLEHTLDKMDNLDGTTDGNHFDDILEANPFADAVSSSTQPVSSEQQESTLSSSPPTTTVSHKEPEQRQATPPPPPPTAAVLSSSPVSTHLSEQQQQQQTLNSSSSSISNGMASLQLDAEQQPTTTRDSLEEVASEYSQVLCTIG